MNRKFKALSLSLFAVLALSAVSASGVQANFTSSLGAGIGISGTSTADEFTAFGSTVKCTENSFSGTTTAATSNEITITPQYKNCKFGVFPATVDFTGCDYKFTSTTPEVHVVCPAGKRIDITVFASAAAHTANTPICHIYIGAQTVKGHVYANSGANDVNVSGKVSNIHAIEHRTSAVCPGGEGTEVTTTTAQYDIQAGGIVVKPASGSLRVD